MLFFKENCQSFIIYLKKWGWRFFSSIIFQNLRSESPSPLILSFLKKPELEVTSKLNTREQVIVQWAIFVKTTWRSSCQHQSLVRVKVLHAQWKEKEAGSTLLSPLLINQFFCKNRKQKWSEMLSKQTLFYIGVHRELIVHAKNFHQPTRIDFH